MRDVAYPAMDVLRTRYFGSHPDDRVIFHRKELMNKKPPFQALRDRDVEESFNRDFLNLVRDLNYVVFTVAIDKWEHIEKYHKWAAHPYHYCMEVLLERYQRWLRRMNAEGDVMAEARGKKEDYALAAEYTKIWTNGTVTPEMALVEASKILRKHLNPFVQYFELGSDLANDTPSWRCATPTRR